MSEMRESAVLMSRNDAIPRSQFFLWHSGTLAQIFVFKVYGVLLRKKNTRILLRRILHIVSTLYSEHLHIVNNFGETFQWRLIRIVSLYSEHLHIVNQILLQIVLTIWRDDCTTLELCVLLLLQCKKKARYGQFQSKHLNLCDIQNNMTIFLTDHV